MPAEPPANRTATVPEDPRAARVRDLIGAAVRGQAPAVALIGFPVDEGVRRNGGRVGAALAPHAIRTAFLDLSVDGDPSLRALLARTCDTGDLAVSGDLERDQERLGTAVADCLSIGTIPMIVGGGHETAYGHFLGYVRSGRRVAIVNWDAHTDVRDLANGQGHSGSPFRQAILHESGCCRRYTVAGLLPEKILPVHLEFIRQRNGRFIWNADLSRDRVEQVLACAVADGDDPVMVSFDVDAVEAQSAPGVSAPSVGGLPPDVWLHAAYAAGRTPRVSSMDLVEVNPAFDPDARTIQLAAQTIREFLRGAASRLLPVQAASTPVSKSGA